MKISQPFAGWSFLETVLLTIFFLAGYITEAQKATLTPPLINQEIISQEGEPVLVGRIDRTVFTRAPYRDWFEAEYQAYTVDAGQLAGLRKVPSSVEFLVFLGTWCSDSQRELPRLLKILDFLQLNEERLKIIALDNHPDRYKKSPQGEEENWNIEYVPTFIVLREGKEIGRITEAPQTSLERDLSVILGSEQ